jgi:hypothetical protein
MMPCATPDVPPFAVQIGIEAHHHEIAGMAIAALDGDSWSLTLLAPAGFELFTVSDAGVQTGLESWRPWLEALPVERDLRLAFTDVSDGACDAGDGRLRARGDTTRWRGKGGPARATREAGRITIRDWRRGYSVTLVVDDDAAP